MLIQTLRKQVTVVNWNTTKDTVRISYFRSYNGQSKSLHLIISPLEYLNELDTLAMIDGVKEDQVMAIVNGTHYFYDDFIAAYPMCQWEALSIAIRHEEEKELANDMSMLELDAAIDALRDY